MYPIKIERIEFWSAPSASWVAGPALVNPKDPVGIRITASQKSIIGPYDVFFATIEIYDKRGWKLIQVEGSDSISGEYPNLIYTFYSKQKLEYYLVEQNTYLGKVKLWWKYYPSLYDHLIETWEGAVATSGIGVASFVFSPPDGYAPLEVTFNDTNNILVPITARLWDFGDGTTSQMTNPTHTYKTSGDYTATLTLTTEYGVAQATATIRVFSAPTYPAFEGCWFPNQAWVGQAFTPIIRIKNEGGEGNCYIKYMVEGIEHTLVDSVLVGEFGQYIWSESHPIEWWLGYAPSKSKMVNIGFKTGHVGKPPTSTWPIVVSALVPELGRANLYGIVQDKEGNSLADAAITLDSYSTISASNGSYSFTDIPIGSYIIRCQKEGYWGYEASIHLYGGANEHNIVLTLTAEPPPFEIPWKIILPVAGLLGLLLYATRRK